jgi:hypothetical protein
MSKPVDQVIYARAAALIERSWTKDVMARDAEGNAVCCLSDTAVEFCAAAAIARAGADMFGIGEEWVHFIGNMHCDMALLVCLNDTKGKEPVLSMLKTMVSGKQKCGPA